MAILRVALFVAGLVIWGLDRRDKTGTWFIARGQARLASVFLLTPLLTSVIAAAAIRISPNPPEEDVIFLNNLDNFILTLALTAVAVIVLRAVIQHFNLGQHLARPASKRTLSGGIIAGIIALVILIVIIIIQYNANPLVTTAVLSSTLRQSTPIVLGALCGMLGERTGIINIGIEGQMLMAAFTGFIVSSYTNNLFLAVIAGVVTGGILGTFLAFMSVTLKMDQIIGGTVINILALGLTSFFYQSGLTTEGKLPSLNLGPLADIPLIGPVFFAGNGIITYISLLLVLVVHFTLFYTRWGLRTRAVGEHPSAADTVGINVHLMRYINVTIAGCISGLAGAYLTLEAVGSFERGMTNGRGFVALAVMIFGKYMPFGAWGAALLFGFATALQTQLQFGGEIDIPHQFIGMLPYLLTIVVLAGFVGRTRPPAAIGQPYEKE